MLQALVLKSQIHNPPYQVPFRCSVHHIVMSKIDIIDANSIVKDKMEIANILDGQGVNRGAKESLYSRDLRKKDCKVS
jgi:hypothetical protein